LTGAAARYFHTLRHLRLRQWTGRLRHVLPKPAPRHAPPPPCRAFVGRWSSELWREPSWVGPDEFRFARETRPVRAAADWNRAGTAALWLYNLHYFEDLNAVGAEGRAEWHRCLIGRWIDENPAGVGVGWDPYPTSLRIVNWIKWALRGGSLSDAALASLALQVRWLETRLETHLLGNHLWSNAKALSFAGVFFAGEEASCWSAKGCRLIEEELAEQCLPDGGHFERSPMYHGIFLEDVLDLAQLVRLQPSCFPSGWPAMLAAVADRMTEWMAAMVHPDGDIAFFNDATSGVCARLAALRPSAAAQAGAGLRHMAPSGFLRMQAGAATVFADVGSVGPDHLPGHAHAGTLSFELSVGAARAVVNGGVSVYGTSAERQRQRGSRAHSTLVIDGQDSSEVWAGFRVARRARVVGTGDVSGDGLLRFWAAHDGYRRLSGSPLHKRTWSLGPDGLSVVDEVTGAGSHRLEIVFHLAPGWRAEPTDASSIRVSAVDPLPGSAQCVTVRYEPPFEALIEGSSWHPGFGIAVPSSTIILRAQARLPLRHTTRIGWHPAA
jgi:uncharacterized heparinase superfamily protein